MPSRTPLRLLVAIVLSTAAGLAACDSSEDTSDTASDTGTTSTTSDATNADMGMDVVPSSLGEAVYLTPREDGNSFACATCHSLTEPAADGFRRVGHPVGGAGQRGAWKNGATDSLLGAVNSCLTEWMSADAYASADDPDFVALAEYLDGFASGAEQPINFTIQAPPTDLAGGDIERGRGLFETTCASCHAADGSITNLAAPLGGTGLEADYIARRVRTSGLMDSGVYDGLTGGRMPFWSVERLSDDDLRDIIAFVVDLSSRPMVQPDVDMADTADVATDTAMPDMGMPDMGGGCASTHPKVGQSLTFTERFHDVGGTATIVDDCTVRLDNFTYDATGIDVRIYGGIGGDYDPPVGFPISDDLIRAQPYAGETLTLTLPGDKTLDDLDGLSVWCVDVSVSFGDGIFQ